MGYGSFNSSLFFSGCDFFGGTFPGASSGVSKRSWICWDGLTLVYRNMNVDRPIPQMTIGWIHPNNDKPYTHIFYISGSFTQRSLWGTTTLEGLYLLKFCIGLKTPPARINVGPPTIYLLQLVSMIPLNSHDSRTWPYCFWRGNPPQWKQNLHTKQMPRNRLPTTISWEVLA